MGCRNSKDAMESAQVQPGMGLVKKESFRPLEQEDRYRINKVLQYWFETDVGASSSSF